MKKIFSSKIVTVLLAVLLAVCVVFGAGFSFAKYVMKVDFETVALNIFGPPSKYTLVTGPEFNATVSGLLEENTTVTKLEFGSLTDYPAIKEAWQKSEVYLDEANEGAIRAVVDVDTSTIYVLSFRDNTKSEYYPSTKAMFANENSSGMFKHNLEAAGEEYKEGFIPEGRLTAIEGLDEVDTRPVENMSSMFMFCTSLTELNVTSFDTSKVTDMSYMFRDCKTLTTLDVSNFDTGKVENMKEMFRFVTGMTTLDLSNFDTSNVINMQGLFHDSTGLTTIKGYEDFDTSNVENMSYMFNNCYQLTSLDLSNFNTAKVTDMRYMFRGCGGLTTIKGYEDFDTSNVENMSYMFALCGGLTSLDLSHFDTSKVEDMQHMFHDCHNLTHLNISSFNTAKVTNMAEMFRGLYSLTELDLSSFVTTEVTNMSYMFWDLQKVTVLDLSKFDTQKVTDMTGMFGDCKSLTTIYAGDNWTATNATEGDDKMFGYRVEDTRPQYLTGGAGTQWSSSHIDKEYARIDGGTAEPGYLTYKVTLTTGTDFNSKIKDLFTTGVTKLRFDNYNAIAAEITAGTLTLDDTLENLWNNSTTAYVDVDGTGTIRAFASGDTVYVLSKGYGVIFANEDCSNMFKHSFETYATGYIPQGTLTAIAGLDKVNTSKVKDMSHMFEYCTSLAALDVTSFDTSNVTDMSWMFRDCSALTTLDVSGLETGNVTNMQEMFRYIAKVATLDLSNFDTSNVTNMQGMFQDCDALTTITGLGTYSTAAVKNMSWMFKGCDKLATLTFGVNFKTNAVTTMQSMFEECSSLPSLNLSQFDTGNVRTMYGMFFRCSGLKALTVPFDTKNLEDMALMFHSCSGLTSLDVSSFDTKKVKSLYETFRGCSGLTSLDVTNFDTSSVTDMRHTFRELNITTLDLSNFDTSNVDNMSNMFNACTKLKTIYVSAKGWNTEKVEYSESMFHDCNALVGGEGTAFANEKANAPTDNLDYRDGTIYARIDKAITEGVKGYLTEKGAPGAAQLVAGTTFNTAINGLFSDTVTTLRFGTYDEIEAEITAGTLTLADSLATLWANGTYVDVNQTGAIRVFTDTTSGTVYVLSEGSRAIYANPDSSYMFNGNDSGTDYTIQSYLTEIIGLDAIDTGNVTSMEAMFRNCRSLNSLDVSNFDTSSVLSMKFMFSSCESLTLLDVSGFDTGSVTIMQSMFYNCSKLTSLDVSGFDTSSVSNMKLMFYGCSSLTSLDVSGFDTGSVTEIQSMFFNCSSLTSLDLLGFDTGNVTNMEAMFYGCSSLTSLDLSSFNTSSVTEMYRMFYGCSSLEKIYVSGDWTVTNVTSSGEMFLDCTVLKGGEGTPYDSAVVDQTYARIDKVDTDGTKGYLTEIPTYTLYQGNFSSVMNELKPTKIVFGQYGDYSKRFNWDTDGMYFDSSEEIKYFTDTDEEGTTVWVLSTGKIAVNSIEFFRDMTFLKEIEGLGKLNTSSLTSMWGWFYGCSSLTSVDLSGLNTSNVTAMGSMFLNCTSLTSVNLSGIDTSKVDDFSAMFSGCSSLVTLDLSGFDTNSATGMGDMFMDCSSLVTLDLSNFTTASVTTVTKMFSGCGKLTTIWAKDWNLSYFNGSGDRMFENCTSLVGGNGTAWSAEQESNTDYARIDGGESNPGYFTDPATKP